jgi:hypothetical protein
MGIAFNDWSITRIRAGAKTQTRRLAGAPESLAADEVWAQHPPRYKTGVPYYIKEALARHGDVARYALDRQIVLERGRAAAWCWRRDGLPAMYCPRWAARSQVVFVGIELENTPALTDAQAQADGVTADDARGVDPLLGPGAYAAAYAAVWRSLHPKQPLDARPWRYVYTFRTEDIARG